MKKRIIGLICIFGVAVWVIGCALSEPVEDNVAIQDETMDVVEADVTEPAKSDADNNDTSEIKGGATTPTITPTSIVEDMQVEEVANEPEEAIAPSVTDDDTQSYYEKGRELGQEVKEYLQDIDWDDKQEKAREAGKEAADFINGLFD